MSKWAIVRIMSTRGDDDIYDKTGFWTNNGNTVVFDSEATAESQARSLRENFQSRVYLVVRIDDE